MCQRLMVSASGQLQKVLQSLSPSGEPSQLLPQELALVPLLRVMWEERAGSF